MATPRLCCFARQMPRLHLLGNAVVYANLDTFSSLFYLLCSKKVKNETCNMYSLHMQVDDTCHAVLNHSLQTLRQQHGWIGAF
eukprot:124645-Amphidinium_carterae.1